MEQKTVKSKDTPYFLIQSVDRTLQIFQLFIEERRPMGVSEISNKLSLHKSIIHRLLATLCYHGYLQQDAGNEQYMIGPKAFELGSVYSASNNLIDLGKQVLAQMVDDFRLTSHLAILEGTSVLYLLNYEPDHLKYLYGAVGQRKAIYSTALGKCLTAWLPTEKTTKLLETCDFEPKTEYTIRSLEQFLEELAVVRKQGYAVDRDESVLGARCVAAPVRDTSGNVVAAISISGYGDDMAVSKLEEFGLKLKGYAAHFSRRLGYFGD